MKALSVKANVTIWYTSFLVAVLAVALVIVLNFSDASMLSNEKDGLINTVVANSNDVEIVDEMYDFSDLKRFDDNANIIVHSRNGDLLFGQYPAGFPDNTQWTYGNVERVSSGGKHWIVYDHLVQNARHEDIVIRGISSVDSVFQTINTAAMTTIFLFPILILFVAFGGYRITQKAFLPVKKISDAVSEINKGEDLTKRMGLKDFAKGGDEIQVLAETFDAMFERLQKSFEREKQFTADASHELRTPTTVIMSECEYALSVKDQEKDVEKSLLVILKQSQKISEIISQLLLITRTDNRENALKLEWFDLSDLVESIVAELTPSARKLKIDIKNESESGLMMKADQLLIVRLLINLLSNGIKFGKENGAVIIRLSKDDQQLVGKISDNGVGIDEEEVTKIWDRFYQANPTRTADRSESIGLGLSMVKAIVEAHQGMITVESTLGEGTTFEFRIPIEGKRSNQ